MTKALEIENVRKIYSNKVEALRGVSLNIEEGDFFALLGPNGAGKTTLIGIISGLVNKTGGKVKIFGHDIDTESALAKTYIGVVPQEINFNFFEKVLDIVVNQAGYYGVSRKISLERAEKYLKQLGLWDKRNHKAMSLSGGMKRRLMIARALIHEPRLLILDEPTAGVDIELRYGMWDFLRNLSSQKVTIILTTHYLEEAEKLCRGIAIINKGVIAQEGNMKKILAKLDEEDYILELKKPVEERDLGVISQTYKTTFIDSQTVEIVMPKNAPLNDVFELFSRHGMQVVGMRSKTNRLEEVFLMLTREEKISGAK